MSRPTRVPQVDHGRDVWVLGTEEPGSYDAMVTDQTGVVLAAPGADCMPILFVDPRSKVIAVAHAGETQVEAVTQGRRLEEMLPSSSSSGWKGTVLGIAMATVTTMAREFGCRASDILVAVGPSVGVCCFQLDRDQAADFIRIHPDCVPDPEASRPHVDIRLANR